MKLVQGDHKPINPHLLTDIIFKAIALNAKYPSALITLPFHISFFKLKNPKII